MNWPTLDARMTKNIGAAIFQVKHDDCWRRWGKDNSVEKEPIGQNFPRDLQAISPLIARFSVDSWEIVTK